MGTHKILTNDTIVSIDIETTGLTAGIHSMIELGAVAYRNGKEIGSFSGAMKEWEGSERSVETMRDFWMVRNRAVWDRIRKESRPPEEVMQEFATWLDSLPGPLVLAGNPASFDSGFLFFYMHKFIGEKATSQFFKRSRALDIRTFIMALFAVPYSQAERSVVPEAWTESNPYTHNAIDDARNQGAMLMSLLKASVGEMEMEA